MGKREGAGNQSGLWGQNPGPFTFLQLPVVRHQ